MRTEGRQMAWQVFVSKKTVYSMPVRRSSAIDLLVEKEYKYCFQVSAL
jgi:hypothetical protein